MPEPTCSTCGQPAVATLRLVRLGSGDRPVEFSCCPTHVILAPGVLLVRESEMRAVIVDSYGHGASLAHVLPLQAQIDNWTDQQMQRLQRDSGQEGGAA